MLDTINGLLSLSGQVSEADPDQYGASDVVALDTRFSTLIFLNSGQLPDFEMKPLDFPVHGCPCASSRWRRTDDLLWLSFTLKVAGSACVLRQMATPYVVRQFGVSASSPIQIGVVAGSTSSSAVVSVSGIAG